MKTYISLQACVAVTFIFVIIMTVRYSSSVAFFEVKPAEEVAKITSNLFDHHPERKRLKEPSSIEKQANHHHQPFDYILENQRVRIATEMDQFPFENNPDQQLLDLIPESGGQPKRAMVVKSNHVLPSGLCIIFFPHCRLLPHGEVDRLF